MISAVLKSEDGLTEDVLVSSLEQPLNISLPTSYLGTNGICYVGIRFSENEPWQYRVVSENGTIALNLRGKASSIPSECNIDLYRPNIQLALFVYDETSETASSTANIVVSEMTATSTSVINIVDGAYQEDLTVKLALEGTNLSGLNASDLTARVTFRSSNATAMTIMSNGTKVTTIPASDKAVTGANYTHTFKVPSLTFENQLGTTAELSFVINTKKMNASDFPTEFLIELNGVSENVIGGSFVCSEYFAFETASLKDYTLNLIKGTGIDSVSGAGSYQAGTSVTASCTMLAGYEFANWSGDFDTESFTMPAKDVTMTANAKPIEYKISYITDGGVFANGVASPTLYTAASESFTLPTPTKTNYSFVGWVIDDGAPVETVTIAQGSTGDKTYTANWTPVSYTITYNLDGGNLASGVTNPETYNVESADITLKNPTKTGYDFVGWTGTGIATGTASQTLTIPLGSTGDRSYVASWTEVLTFNLGNGVTMELKPCGDTGMFMGTYEVTQEQYFAIMGTNPSNFRGGLATTENPHGKTTASCPVECVSWDDIMAGNGFIAKLNASDTIRAYLTDKGLFGYKFALPTQEQWETACNAGTDIEDSDDNVNDRAWYNDNADGKTHDVGCKYPNAWGLYDMRGNVWEWTSEQSDSDRVLCGGSWNDPAFKCRSSFYDSFGHDLRYYSIGFRVALVAPGPK